MVSGAIRNPLQYRVMIPAPVVENPRTSFLDWVESLTKLGAMLFALTYGAGFIVLSLHHAQFGVVELSLLKIRVLSAGVIVLMLTLLPVVAAGRVFGYFDLGSRSAVVIESSPEHQPLQQIVLVIGMYAVAVGLALTSSTFLLVNDMEPESGGTSLWWLLLMIPIMLGFAPAIAHYFPDHPRKCLAAVLGVMPVLAFCVHQSFGMNSLSLSMWYYACCVATYAIRIGVREQGWLRNFEIERHIGIPLGLLAAFSVFVYGKVKPELGGGSPIPVQVYVNSEGANVLGGESATAWLIEQTDYGFYLLRQRGERKALLLPRSLIRVVEFRVDPKSPKVPAS